MFRAVQDAYVEPVDDHTLMQSAIRGLLAGLDPHSEFLDTRGLGELDEQATGEYAGLGVEVLFMEGVLRVIAPIDDTPAQRAGIKPGDIILRIDGELIGADEGDRAVERLRGKAGSQTTLSVLREGLDVPLEITLRRERIKVASVRVRSLEPGYAYVRISQFQQETGAELRRKLRQLHAATAASRARCWTCAAIRAGCSNAAVEVSDAFLDSGVIVSTRGRLADSDLRLSATEGDLTGGAPMVVLVDGGTASAAEIVAGALKDNHRALVMGTRTFGKGSVQTVLPLEPVGAVKLTTARYYTPSGVSIQASGIVPDIALADLQLSAPDRPATPLTSERSLPGHLEGDGEGAGGDSPRARQRARRRLRAQRGAQRAQGPAPGARAQRDEAQGLSAGWRRAVARRHRSIAIPRHWVPACAGMTPWEAAPVGTMDSRFRGNDVQGTRGRWNSTASPPPGRHSRESGNPLSRHAPLPPTGVIPAQAGTQWRGDALPLRAIRSATRRRSRRHRRGRTNA